jgi:hypothetical protein
VKWNGEENCAMKENRYRKGVEHNDEKQDTWTSTMNFFLACHNSVMHDYCYYHHNDDDDDDLWYVAEECRFYNKLSSIIILSSLSLYIENGIVNVSSICCMVSVLRYSVRVEEKDDIDWDH